MKKAIVTGPTGVVGTALVKKLVEKGLEVYAVCRPASKRIDTIMKHPCVHVVQCDLNNLNNLNTLIKTPCDIFFHLGWAGTEDPLNRFDMYLQNENIKHSLDAVQAADSLYCKIFMGAGSQAEYGNKGGVLKPDTYPKPESGYGMAKLCAGQMTRYLCKKAGIKHVWVRIVSVYGKGDGKQTLISTAIRTMLAGEKLSMTTGKQVWDYLFSEDAAEALYDAAVLGKDGAVYVIGSGEIRTLKEYVEIIRNYINPKLEIGFGDKPYFKDQVMHLQADITTLTQDTGWEPSTSFEEGIKFLIDNFNN